jgi:hypothetical protein
MQVELNYGRAKAAMSFHLSSLVCSGSELLRHWRFATVTNLYWMGQP